MKILHIAPGGVYGGVNAIVSQLTHAQRLRGNEAQIFLIYAPSQPVIRELQSYNIPFHVIEYEARLNLRYWKVFADYIRQIRPDIICFHMPYLWTLMALKLFYRKECPWIYYIHTYPPGKKLVWNQTRRFSPPPQVRLKTYLLRNLIRQTMDCLVGVSHSVTDVGRRFFRLDSKLYRTIYNGIQLLGRTDQKNGWPDFMQNITPSRPLIGFGMRLAYDKGINEFIDVIPHIIHQLPEALFVLAGEGPLERWAKDYAIKKGLKDSLFFPGFIRDMNSFWSNLDFALFTSPREAMPMSLIEAQATGAVVAGYLNGSGSDEIILPGLTGLLVPWGHKEELAREIAQLWSDGNKYHKMVVAAKDRIKHEFTIDKNCQQHLELYRELIESKNNHLKVR